jgi:hypothetical protein
MPSGVKADLNATDADGLAVNRDLLARGELGAVAQRHDRQGFPGCHDGPVSRAGVVGVTMRDQRPRAGPGRVDEEVSLRAIKAARCWGQYVLRGHRRHM